MKRYIFFAFGIGISIGASIALLYAPQSGVATRKKIKRSAQDASDYLEDTAGYLKEQAEYLASEAQKLVENTKSAVEQAGGIVSGAIKTAQKLV